MAGKSLIITLSAKSFSWVHSFHMLACVPTVLSSHDSCALGSGSRTRNKEGIPSHREKEEHNVMNEVNFLKNEGQHAD